MLTITKCQIACLGQSNTRAFRIRAVQFARTNAPDAARYSDDELDSLIAATIEACEPRGITAEPHIMLLYMNLLARSPTLDAKL